ncbi:hypothetical protein GCU67_10580 [Modestobacter muralis]|uniref:Transmembrane protein n=1 Tax=Modestobacter muralis TaxID=1608614 RepID=A0A6P0H8T5_9ACTN|nr:hypothetical protein [Modestobacter muralis]NEK94611.1 hypothetical protein [Modestobacter muralis]NEN51499.1 hypothetical protein [Modestobacter muralis]
MESNRLDRDDAAAQLAVLQADRAALADRSMQPWWYDALLGSCVFVLLGAQAFDDPVVTVVGCLLGVAGLSWLVRTYQRLTGTWVSGFRKGRTRKAIAVWLVLYVLVVVPAFVLHLGYGQHWVMAVAGAVLGIALAFISRWWSRIHVAELRGAL